MGPLLGNELPVPTEDGVGSNERSDFGEGAAADSLAPDRESASLCIGQAESSTTELLLEDSVLFSEIVDDRILMAAEPTGERSHEDLPGLKHRRHPEIVAKSSANRQLSN